MEAGREISSNPSERGINYGMTQSCFVPCARSIEAAAKDIYQIFILRGPCERDCASVVESFTASRGRNPIDMERRGFETAVTDITGHARKTRRRVRSLSWGSITR